MNTTIVPSAITPSKYVSARFGSGKVAFPVSNLTGHAQFEHVRGVPAGESSGLSVNRLFILNSLLGRYSSSNESPSEISDQGSGRIPEPEIATKVQRLHESVAHSVYGRAYGNGLYESGVVLSIVR